MSFYKLKLIIRMSEQGNLEASESMHGFDNMSGLSHFKCSLEKEKDSQMHGCYEKEIPFVGECKQTDLSDFKDIYDNVDMKSDMGNYLKENMMVENKGDAEEALDSDAEDYSTEDLSHALEVDLNLNSADKRALCIDLPEMGTDLSCKDKKKKRKKRKGPTKNPNQIFAFNEEEQKKIEQNKSSLDTKKEEMCKILSKSATFPVSAQHDTSSKDVQNLEVAKFESATEGGPESECGCADGKNSFYTRTLSFPPSFILTPAIRGGHEKNGYGPRPKLCVKWAPDVYEPPRSSVSHTVRNYQRYQSKKKDHKQKQKGKSSPRGSNIKNDKQLAYNSNCNMESFYARLRSQNAGNKMLLDVLPSRVSALEAPLLNLQMGQDEIPLNIALMHPEHCHRNKEDGFTGKCTDDLASLGKGNLSSSAEAEYQLSQDSKCSSSFLRTLESKRLSFAEATR